jgi:hypothetical protein
LDGIWQFELAGLLGVAALLASIPRLNPVGEMIALKQKPFREYAA